MNDTLSFGLRGLRRATCAGRAEAALAGGAQAARLPVEPLVNRVMAWFVPAVLTIAVANFIVWWALAGLAPATVAAVSVLIIACP